MTSFNPKLDQDFQQPLTGHYPWSEQLFFYDASSKTQIARNLSIGQDSLQINYSSPERALEAQKVFESGLRQLAKIAGLNTDGIVWTKVKDNILKLNHWGISRFTKIEHGREPPEGQYINKLLEEPSLHWVYDHGGLFRVEGGSIKTCVPLKDVEKIKEIIKNNRDLSRGKPNISVNDKGEMELRFDCLGIAAVMLKEPTEKLQDRIRTIIGKSSLSLAFISTESDIKVAAANSVVNTPPVKSESDVKIEASIASKERQEKEVWGGVDFKSGRFGTFEKEEQDKILGASFDVHKYEKLSGAKLAPLIKTGIYNNQAVKLDKTYMFARIMKDKKEPNHAILVFSDGSRDKRFTVCPCVSLPENQCKAFLDSLLAPTPSETQSDAKIAASELETKVRKESEQAMPKEGEFLNKLLNCSIQWRYSSTGNLESNFIPQELASELNKQLMDTAIAEDYVQTVGDQVRMVVSPATIEKLARIHLGGYDYTGRMARFNYPPVYLSGNSLKQLSGDVAWQLVLDRHIDVLNHNNVPMLPYKNYEIVDFVADILNPNAIVVVLKEANSKVAFGDMNGYAKECTCVSMDSIKLGTFLTAFLG